MDNQHNKNERKSYKTTSSIKRAQVKSAIKTGGRTTGAVIRKVIQWVLNITLTLILIGTITGIIVGVTFVNYIKDYLYEPDYDIDITKYRYGTASDENGAGLSQTTKIFYYESDDIYLQNPIELEDQRIYGTENRSWVTYNDIPEQLVHAFISIEDERFFSHNGVDWKRTFGAVLQFVSGNSSYGGSTITQQLIKNITKEDDTTIQRKVKEILRAQSLTKNRSREDILEMYLNTIHLSRSNYGVQAAANYYFGKDVSELTLVECAALAALPKSPTKYDPVKNPDNNAERRILVLDKMSELGYITKTEAEEAKNTVLVINQNAINETTVSSNSYFKDALIEQIISDLIDEYGYSRERASALIYSGGLEIYATVDPEIQSIMEEVFSDPDTFQKVAEGIQPESAMVVMDPYTGYVKGIVGGREKTGDRDLNRATMSRRQIGSSIKPLTVYAPAMDLGLINYASVIDDTPVKYEGSIGRYWPKNAPNRYDGLININKAVEVSKNTTAVKVLEELSVDYSFNFAKNKLGLKSLVASDKDIAPLAMGGLTNGLTVLEVTAAYSIFPNDGTYTSPRLYTKVLKSDGTILLQADLEQIPAINADTAAVMTKILQNVVSNGTANAITLDNKGLDIAGKTGSTNDDKDRFFAGFTPYYVGACWFGYDTPRYLGAFTSNPAMLAWEKVMARIHQKYLDEAASGYPIKTFDFTDIEKTEVCLDSGMRPGPYCSNDLRGSRVTYAYFPKNEIPTETCNVHRLVKWDSTTAMVATPYCPEEYCMEVPFVLINGREFEMNIAVTDAQYTCMDVEGDFTKITNNIHPYYVTAMRDGVYAGYSDYKGVVDNPKNGYCIEHRSPVETDVSEDNEGESDLSESFESEDTEQSEDITSEPDIQEEISEEISGFENAA